nr:MAG TPA: hypothetical protein [Caudoviricetes sp.]
MTNYSTRATISLFKASFQSLNTIMRISFYS